MKVKQKQSKGVALGFTLVEILVVVAILAILSGLIFPTFASAKRQAKITVAHSNLRQQFLVLEIYAGDNESTYPDFDVVKQDKKMQLPCSPLDTWDTNCWGRSAPMLGSFGYIVPMKELFTHELFPSGTTMPILCDAFSSDYRLGKFDGFIPDINKCASNWTCEVPEKVWFAFTDGSIRIERHRAPPTNGADAAMAGLRALFTWHSIFIDARAPAFQ